MELRGVLERIPIEVAERIVGLLPLPDVAHLRLVSKKWKLLTNPYVKRLHPASLTPFLEGTVSNVYPNLETIDLSSVDIVDDGQLRSLAYALAELPLLRDLVIRCGGDVTDQGFKMLGCMVPQLRWLSIRPCGSQFDDCMVCHVPALDLDVVPFRQFENLVRLDLVWNTITTDAINAIAALENLEILSVKNCLGVDDSILDLLATMPSLRVLNLSNTNITDDGLAMMNELDLEALNLSKCEGITDVGMYYLQQVRSLKKVDISSCPWITSAGVEQLSNLPNLTDLYLQDLKGVGSSFFKKMKRLESLNLRDCVWVKDGTLQDLTACENLQSLNLRNCDQISDAGLKFLRRLPLLRSVNLRGCTKITDSGIEILSALPMIEDIDLSFLNRITDAGLKSLVKTATLRRLILNWCNLITSVGLHELQNASTRLEQLSIKGCHNMQFTDLSSMAKFCSHQKLDYEHSLCSVHTGAQTQELPRLHPIDSVGCFLEIC